jgi:hypothetical protein
VYLESVSAARTKDAVVLLGFPAERFDTARIRRIGDRKLLDSTIAPRIAGVEISKLGVVREVALPERTGAMLSPHAVENGPGVGAVWSSRKDTQETLWYAQLHDGRWSAPQQLSFTGRLTWDGDAGTVLRTSNGQPVVLTGATSEDHRFGLLVARPTRDGWYSTHVALPSAPGYVTAAPTRQGIAIVYVAADSNARAFDRNSVFTAQLRADSLVAPPVLIRRSGRGGAWAPIMLGGPDTLHVLWLAQSETATRVSSIAHYRSTDGGDEWVPLPSLETGAVDRFSAVLLKGRIVQLAFRSSDGGEIRTATWDTRWSPIATTGLVTSSHLDFFSMPDGSLALTFVRWKNLAPIGEWPAAWIASPHSERCKP